MARIGVEPTLTNVKSALMEMGHEVVDIHSDADAENCDLCVISGMDKDMMGISEISITGSVINADGISADDVCQMVDERLS